MTNIIALLRLHLSRHWPDYTSSETLSPRPSGTAEAPHTSRNLPVVLAKRNDRRYYPSTSRSNSIAAPLLSPLKPLSSSMVIPPSTRTLSSTRSIYTSPKQPPRRARLARKSTPVATIFRATNLVAK